MKTLALTIPCVGLGLMLLLDSAAAAGTQSVTDASPLREKAKYFQQDLRDKHLLEGLYVSIVPSAPAGTRLPHTVNEPGNVIHAGVWTGRYLAGVGYQYAVTRSPRVREHGGEILQGLRTLQEVTGKPGLLARGYVKGHGPVEGWERHGQDSIEWHQGQGKFADYRWHGDVSVDNFNAVLYGYAIYYDLAADAEQKKIITRDVDRLMTHVLDNHCCIIDMDGEVTRWGHIGLDPDPARDEYYQKLYAPYLKRLNLENAPWRPSLRRSLMLLPDLLIAHHITGQPRYLDFYRKVIARFKNNPEQRPEGGPFSLERLARVNHSSEGQSYEALFNLIRYERDPELLALYRPWVSDLWEMNWMEGNALFAYMTASLLPEYHDPKKPGVAVAEPAAIPHGEEGLRLAWETLKLFPISRVLAPVMNSSRKDIERNPHRGEDGSQSARPIPINERPLDNEDTWKGNPYNLDGWFKPTITMIQFAADDPQVSWFCDTSGKLFETLNGGKEWREMNGGLRGASVQNIVASRKRTFVLHAQTDQGVFITRDGGLSWRAAAADDKPEFTTPNFKEWQPVSATLMFRITDSGELVRSRDGGQSAVACMAGWRIPRANSFFLTPWRSMTPRRILASGPGGSYASEDGEGWSEVKLWPEQETGAADFLHAYWMGRYYGFIKANE